MHTDLVIFKLDHDIAIMEEGSVFECDLEVHVKAGCRCHHLTDGGLKLQALELQSKFHELDTDLTVPESQMPSVVYVPGFDDRVGIQVKREEDDGQDIDSLEGDNDTAFLVHFRHDQLWDCEGACLTEIPVAASEHSASARQ